MKEKEKIKDEELCEGLPREFLIYMKHVRSLEFDERPYYNSLIKMFKKLLENNKGKKEFDFS